MKINGYQKNQYHDNKCHHNIDSKKNTSSLTSAFHSLLEVEHFLCNVRKISKCLNLYKFLK